MRKILWSQLRTWILIFNINSKQSQKLCNRRKKKIIDYKKKTTYCPIALWYIGVLDFPVHFLRCDIPSLSCYGETCRLDSTWRFVYHFRNKLKADGDLNKNRCRSRTSQTEGRLSLCLEWFLPHWRDFGGCVLEYGRTMKQHKESL